MCILHLSITLPPPPPLQQQSTTDPALADLVLVLEHICANFEKKNKVQDQTAQALSSRIFKLENHDLYSKIDKYINENVKEVVQNALKALVREHFRVLSEFEMKEILRDRMFESGSYRSQPEHIALYDALEASMDRENREEFMDATAKSRKRCHDDQDPPLPPPKDLNQNDMHLSDSEDTGADHLPKIKTRPDWLKPILEEEMPKTLEPDWIESEHEYDVSAAYGISHWWFKRKEFYITRHSAPSDRRAIRSHMKILSLISLKTFSQYGYMFLRETILRRADYNEYKISEADFKNMHQNDFEDLYLLHLRGNLNQLSGADKVHLFNVVNLWIRNLVIRKRVEDLQFGIKSYQTKLNLTQPNWDASDFLFKEDYTIVHKPRAVIYIDRNDQKKMMRENELHKFSDDALTRILEKLDHMVKDFRLFKFNPGMENRIWFEDDKRRSKEFIEVIERRLKIRRIFRNLESFISGRLRDVDYRLIPRTE
ncbi:hypothetical protein Tco_0786583 [Tanacetum coccineum]